MCMGGGKGTSQTHLKLAGEGSVCACVWEGGEDKAEGEWEVDKGTRQTT